MNSFLGRNQFTVQEPKLESSPELSYVLGVLEGDGCVYKVRRKKGNNLFEYHIQLAATDKDFVQNFNNEMDKILSRKVKVISYKLGSSLFYRVNFRSKPFYEWYNTKSQNEIFEHAYKFPLHFIKGVFDSEGCISLFRSKQKNYPVIRIVNSELELLQSVSRHLLKIGIKSKIAQRKTNKTIIENRKCNFQKPIYCLGIFKKDDVFLFLDKIGTSIKRKMEVLNDREKRI